MEGCQRKICKGEYFLKSAETGNPDGMVQVANCLEVGKGVRKDRNEALRYYNLAASKNYAPAMVSLGEHYMSGDGVQQDYKMKLNNIMMN